MEEYTFSGLPIEKVNEFEDRLYLLLTEYLKEEDKNFLIIEDAENKYWFTETSFQLLSLIKRINETKTDL